MGPENSISELNAFLREVASRPFRWGVWDCMIFTNDAFKRMYGEGWADGLLNRYMNGVRPMTWPQIQQEYGFDKVEEILRDRLEKSYDVPPRGALVTSSDKFLDAGSLGFGFGISVGSSAAFLSDTGVVYYPIEYIDSAWVKQ